jgi:hypothetical protein
MSSSAKGVALSCNHRLLLAKHNTHTIVVGLCQVWLPACQRFGEGGFGVPRLAQTQCRSIVCHHVRGLGSAMFVTNMLQLKAMIALTCCSCCCCLCSPCDACFEHTVSLVTVPGCYGSPAGSPFLPPGLDTCRMDVSGVVQIYFVCTYTCHIKWLAGPPSN